MATSDADRRLQSLIRLAWATRTKLEKEEFVVYLDDVTGIQTDVLVEACRRLEKSATWFPKVSELLETCNAVAREQRIRYELSRPRLKPPPELTPEQKAKYLAAIKRACMGIKGFPKAKYLEAIRKACQGIKDMP